MPPLGWACQICTFQHSYPALRCSMCQNLRVTKEHMREFIAGKPIPEECREGLLVVKDSVAASTASSKSSAAVKQTKVTKASSSTSSLASSALPLVIMKATATASTSTTTAAVKKRSLTNPYARLGGIQKQQPVNQVSQPQGHVPNQGHELTTTTVAATMQQPRPIVSSIQQTRGQVPGDDSNDKRSAPSIHPPLVTTTKPFQVAAVRPSAVQPATAPPSANSHQLAARPVQPATAKPFQLAAKSTPRAFVPGPVPLAPLDIIKEWIYPVDDDYPKRQYQFEIAQTAVLNNTLVSLPTGLGKTLIAAVVLYNYYRWFPTGKVIFLAPTLPLVYQQVKACYDIAGIPASDTAVLTGKIPANCRVQVWKERRVFFCTPQTVQKDIEAARFDPTQVVCIVLDEAHKATGEYAYVKIVEYLESAGAHFRVLGLSATPGTNLAAIQKVADALRINKIEARTDTDPSVSPYIHERKSEIVLVPQVSAVKTIERAMNEMIGPLLEKLRSAGALQTTGYVTVTAFNIIKAREEFAKRTGGDGSLTGYFLAAQTLVQMRADLHKHGVGLVRTKIVRMRNERQRGMMATLVKGKEFQLLWEEVQKATCDPDSSQAKVQDKLINNPKLAKLQEILVEHFERARTGSKSSRAIVFSQYRDSVSEIVSILESSKPLIRPRHFVGQGKGAKGGGQLKGMKQAEQQQVIKEFRQDVYNVLVCTCIGEEGLDIGQVDLIINFDTLRSPIRTIQRIGRTGRKREGRVVCLVAEGPEEKTLNASRQSERNLAHALRNPKSFKVALARPLFPSTPILLERKMTVGNKFRMSQVEGHEGAKKRVAARSDLSNVQGLTIPTSWKLTDLQEKQRVMLLGEVEQFLNDGRRQASLKRRFIQARGVSSLLGKRPNLVSMGRTTRLLRSLERTYKRAPSSGRFSGRRDETVLRAFPFHQMDPNETLANLADLQKLAAPDDVHARPLYIPSNSGGAVEPRETGFRAETSTNNDDLQVNYHACSAMTGKHPTSNSHPLSNTNPVQATAKLPPGPVGASRLDGEDEEIPAPLHLPANSSIIGPLRDASALPASNNFDALVVDLAAADEISMQPVYQPKDFVAPPLLPHAPHPESKFLEDTSNNMAVVDEFCLPSQDSSSSEDESDSEDNGSEKGGMTPVVAPASAENVCQQPVQPSLKDFYLPSQESSSEDGSDDEINEKGPGGEAQVTPPAIAVAPVSTENSIQVPVLPPPPEKKEFYLPSQDSSSDDETDKENCDNGKEGTLVPAVGSTDDSSQEWIKAPPPKRRFLLLSHDTPSTETGIDHGILKHGNLAMSAQVFSSTSSAPFSADDSSEKPVLQPPAKKKRHDLLQRVRRFFDEEAEIRSDDDMDGDAGEMRDLEALEEEEMRESGFINDSSQLGCSPDNDELDLADDDEGMHQALDAQRTRAQQFATPILNRRMKGASAANSNRDSWVEEVQAPDSVSGLGNMHFIRSVIEHHRQGGRAEDIEQFYNELGDDEEEASQEEATQEC